METRDVRAHACAGGEDGATTGQSGPTPMLDVEQGDGCHLTCRYGGVCGVNGSTSPSLLVARRPHPSHDSPPALQHST